MQRNNPIPMAWEDKYQSVRYHNMLERVSGCGRYRLPTLMRRVDAHCAGFRIGRGLRHGSCVRAGGPEWTTDVWGGADAIYRRRGGNSRRAQSAANADRATVDRLRRDRRVGGLGG